MKKLILALALTGLGFSGVASAIEPINAKQVNQIRRIDAGKRSGKLSRAERNALTAQQRQIARMEDRMRARNGGKLSDRDKRVLHARQRQANRDILRAKHNRHRGRNGLHIGL